MDGLTAQQIAILHNIVRFVKTADSLLRVLKNSETERLLRKKLEITMQDLARAGITVTELSAVLEKYGYRTAIFVLDY